MKFIKSMFTALVLVIFFALIGMVVTYAKADLNEIGNSIKQIKEEYTNSSTDDNIEEIPNETASTSQANNNVSSSYIYAMPYQVTDADDLLSYNNTNKSQSPLVGQTSEEMMVSINLKLVVDTDSVNYENVIGLSYETIYGLMYDENMDIWQIAMKNDKNILLKDVYSGYYSEMIIQMVNDETIAKETADKLLVYVMNKLDNEICLDNDEIQEYIDSISEV